MNREVELLKARVSELVSENKELRKAILAQATHAGREKNTLILTQTSVSEQIAERQCDQEQITELEQQIQQFQKRVEKLNLEIEANNQVRDKLVGLSKKQAEEIQNLKKQLRQRKR